MQYLHLLWSGPYKLIELNNLQDQARDYGVYQIYGQHPAYGPNSLLYIGQANRQTFGIRINQEGWKGHSDADNLAIYVGRLAGVETPALKVWEQQITIAERLLIYSHFPAANSAGLNQLPTATEQYHLLNWGHYRQLLPEVSGYRWYRPSNQPSNIFVVSQAKPTE